MASLIPKVIQNERYKNITRLHLKNRITKMEVGGEGGVLPLLSTNDISKQHM
jgi:hypothetical protein